MDKGNGSGSDVVKLALEAGDDWRIRDREFEDKTVIGPAVCDAVAGLEVHECEFEETPEMVFWEGPPHMTIGVIHLENVAFRRCHFRGIAFMGPAAQVAEWRATIGGR
jgi:hypothetical protein